MGPRSPTSRWVLGLGRSSDEPKELLSNGTVEQGLRGQERKSSISEGESHLSAENRADSRTGAITLAIALIQNFLDQVQVLKLVMVLPSTIG
ncbi:hypothetical protein TCAL_15769 [Tigriopus californicus]|uniref:Uncharacterized protein n=1 Tax=Tigriopus californicus TaxID=6832 RepID=A0A553P835_TIGCA|nr:hypothetical protein TCAL_15769 [Tigriopus californicus]